MLVEARKISCHRLKGRIGKAGSLARIPWQEVVHDNDFPTGTRMLPMFVIQWLALVQPDSPSDADTALRRPRLARMVNPF